MLKQVSKTSSYKEFLGALTNETRLEIINLLNVKPMNVSEICAALGFEQSRVSHNLKLLECYGFAKSEKHGKWKIYSIDKETVEPMLKLLDNYVSKHQEKIENCSVLKEGVDKAL
jgi:ArsR family transcriptional regulator, lead/cadmium/zinc/bismuth-responsive transcriptional repressor